MLAVAAFLIAGGRAQSATYVPALIQQVYRAYGECRSYEDSGIVSTVRVKSDGTQETFEARFSTIYLRPGYLRFECQKSSGDQKPRVLWSTGKMGKRNVDNVVVGNIRYVETLLAAADRASPLFEPAGIEDMSLKWVLETFDSLSDGASQLVPWLLGQSYFERYALFKGTDFLLRAPDVLESPSRHQTLYFDAKTHMLLKSVQVSPSYRGIVSETRTITYKYKLNQRISRDQFKGPRAVN